MPAAAVSFSTPHLPTSSSPQTSSSSDLKRKWELVAEPGSHPSKKLAAPKVIDTSVMSSTSLSTLSTADSNNNTTTTTKITNSNNKNASDASLSAFHRSMFQSYVKNALDDLEKVCYIDCGKVKNGSRNRGRLIYKKSEYLGRENQGIL